MDNSTKKHKFFQRRFINLSLTLFFGLALSILFFFIIYYSKDVNIGIGKVINAVKPFIYGAVIAYLLTPMCNYIENLLKKITKKNGAGSTEKSEAIISAVSILLSMCIAFLAIYVLMSLVIPQFVVSLTLIVDNFDTYYDTVTDWLNNFFKDNDLLHDYAETVTASISSTLDKWLQTELLPNTKTLISNVSSGVLSAFSIVKNLFIGIIVAIYFLNSRKSFAAQARIFTHSLFSEKTANKIVKEVRFTNKMFMGFISGRILDSTIIGCLCFIGFSILDMPYTLLISVIVGVTNIIPFFGPFIGGIPSAFLILMASPVKCLWFIIFIIILQQIDGNIIGPKILGDKTNLSSFWVLFAILFFSGLFGFIGMIIGVPVFAVIYHLAQELIMLGLKRTGYTPSKEDADVSRLNKYLEKKETEDDFENQPEIILHNNNSNTNDNNSNTNDNNKNNNKYNNPGNISKNGNKKLANADAAKQTPDNK